MGNLVAQRRGCSRRFTANANLSKLLLACAGVLCSEPAGAQSLKSIPKSTELIELLKHPLDPPAPRVPFPGLPALPELGVHSMYKNTITGEPLLMTALPYDISFGIPSSGTSPFVGPEPYRALEVPLNDTDFVVDPVAAAQLGKALFWDMQIGSDGVQACATCHFHAGADNRTRNQLNPGTNAGDGTLSVRGKNEAVTASDFPFHELADPTIPGEPLLNPANVVRDSNDVLSSMGVMYRDFVNIPQIGSNSFITNTSPRVLAPDLGNAVADPVGAAFQGVRRVEPRNTPTFFASTFNYDNFWDGRARHDFNGGSPHGASDPDAHIFEDGPGGLVATRQLIAMSSLASQATGPALSNFEMSFNGRSWAKIGKKILQAGVTPLANQLVDPTDSVLGPLSNQNTTPGRPGLSVTYSELIEQAFDARLWANTTEHLVPTPDPNDPFDGIELTIVEGLANPFNRSHFTQKEANIALFFGLAVQAYTRLLTPDDSPFDRFHDANPNEFLGIVEDIDPNTPGVQVVGLTDRQLFGYDLFQRSNLSTLNPLLRGGECNVCHFGPNLTEHSVVAIHGIFPPDIVTGEDKILSGFLLENRLRTPAKIAMEQDGIALTQGPQPLPTGIALVDKGIYNIGVRPIAEDIGRGAADAFGFPLSLAALGLANGGFPVGAFSDPNNPLPPLPAHLAPSVNPFPVGAAFPLIELPTFLPDTVQPGPVINVFPAGTFPTPNRVAQMGNFKVPHLKNIELTGPYFHNGGMLTLRQVIDFYSRGGDFPQTNAEHRDPAIANLHVAVDAMFTEDDKNALVDFMLAFTDERVKFERAPFDHPEIIVPIDGTAPDNTVGRDGLLADGRFLRVPEVGAAGRGTPLPNFLGISSVQGDPGPDHFDPMTSGRGFGTIVCTGEANCPCGNDASAGSGQGCTTTTGVGMRITAAGSTSVSADDLTLSATNVPVGNSGIFYVGTNLVGPNNLFDGKQCAGGFTIRFQGQVAGPSGTVSDTGFIAQNPAALTVFQPGQTLYFHYFSRDNQAGPSPCGGNANLSPVMQVTMTP